MRNVQHWLNSKLNQGFERKLGFSLILGFKVLFCIIFLCFGFILFMVFGFCTFFIFNICIHICDDYLVCFHTNMSHGWFFFHVKVHCLLAQGHYFCVHFGCHHLLKANFFIFIFS